MVNSWVFSRILQRLTVTRGHFFLLTVIDRAIWRGVCFPVFRLAILHHNQASVLPVHAHPSPLFLVLSLRSSRGWRVLRLQIIVVPVARAVIRGENAITCLKTVYADLDAFHDLIGLERTKLSRVPPIRFLHVRFRLDFNGLIDSVQCFLILLRERLELGWERARIHVWHRLGRLFVKRLFLKFLVALSRRSLCHVTSGKLLELIKIGHLMLLLPHDLE